MSEEKKSSGCPCTSKCPRNGDCKACQEFHHKSGGKTSCGK